MRSYKHFWVLPLVTLSVALAQELSDQHRSLGDVARETREHSRLKTQDASPQAIRVRELVAQMGINDPAEYGDQIRELLTHLDFDGLEHAAEIARSTKSRLPGGPWKLYVFYDAVSKPVGGRGASDADWNTHVALLQKWISRYPQSTTPRIALAQAYMHYGNKARGSGGAETVTDEGWQSYGGRSQMAFTTLKEAATLPVRCPYWYEAMMQVAIAQGWSKSRTKELVDESISFEPDFYHVYREYANYLQPKWYGNDGEAEAFGKVISERLGGDVGGFVYFEIATVLNCAPCGNSGNTANLSWPKIKEGYVALERLYGTSRLKKNRFASLTVEFRDKDAARNIFLEIGDDWDQDVWRDRKTFETAKSWAVN